MTRPLSLFLCVASLVLLVGCGSKPDKGKASASAKAAVSAAPAGSGSAAAGGEKARVEYKAKPSDVCTAPPPPSSTDNGFVTSDERLWPNGTTLKIGFMDGRPEQIEMVITEANEWMKYANIKFEWYPDPASPPAEPDELVTFGKCPAGNWYVKPSGPGARAAARKGEHTVCLSAYDPEWAGGKGKVAVSAAIKHEFGHVIGLAHEQWNPDLKVTWDKEYVYEWCKTTQDWPKENCDRQVMATIDDIDPKGHWKTSKFDKDSIMFYGISNPNFTKERITYPQPTTISATDKAGIAEVYPGADPSANPEPVKCPGSPQCGGGGEGPKPASTAGYTLGTASKKAGEENGQIVWVVGVAIETGDMSKIKTVHYAFPQEISTELIEGDASQPGHPVGGKVALAPNITGFKVRARVDLQDGTNAILEADLKLQETEEKKKDLLDSLQ